METIHTNCLACVFVRACLCSKGWNCAIGVSMAIVDVWILGHFRLLFRENSFVCKIIYFPMRSIVSGFVLKQRLRPLGGPMVQLGYPFIWGDTNLPLSLSVGVFVGSTEINMNSGVNHKTASIWLWRENGKPLLIEPLSRLQHVSRGIRLSQMHMSCRLRW